MSYLFHQQQRFTLIDHSTKYGVYCQFYTPHASKMLMIAPPTTEDYFAYMDATQSLYIVTLPDAFHLNLHTFEHNHFTKRTLIANSTTNYLLSAPMMYSLNSHHYVSYISHQHETASYHFVQENIDTPNLTTLYSLETQPTKTKCISVTDACTYIFFISHDTQYHLFALEITPKQTTLIKYLTSALPIIDYSVCIQNQTLHVAYVSELHGKYQLCYFNNTTQYITQILTTLSPCKPAIFFYYHSLWLHIQTEHELKMLLSVDNGRTFSMPVNTSIQNNVHRTYFSTQDTQHLCASEIYASISSSIKLCTLAMLDFYQLHSDTHIAAEVSLLLEGMLLASDETPSAPTSKASIVSEPAPPTTPTSRTNSAERYNTPSNKTSPKNDLETAKKAFMEELNGWDLPPRL